MGPSVDHDRHKSGGSGPDSHTFDVGEIPVLPTRRLTGTTPDNRGDGYKPLEKGGPIMHHSRFGRPTTPGACRRWTRRRTSATTRTAPHGAWSVRATSRFIAVPID